LPILQSHQTTQQSPQLWRYSRHTELPDSLAHQRALFADSGQVRHDVADLFRYASRVQVMLGQGIIPADCDPMADQIRESRLAELLGNLFAIVTLAVTNRANHEDYRACHRLTARPAAAAA